MIPPISVTYSGNVAETLHQIYRTIPCHYEFINSNKGCFHLYIMRIHPVEGYGLLRVRIDQMAARVLRS